MNSKDQYDKDKNKDKKNVASRESDSYLSKEERELARLRKENRDLKDAIEILKRAMNAK